MSVLYPMLGRYKAWETRVSETDFGKRYRCLPLELAVLSLHPNAIEVYFHRHFTLLEYKTHFARYATPQKLFDRLLRFEAGEEIRPGERFELGPVIQN